ncbi:MAG: putative molybdenum carrier protein [Kiritimatiellia bacterium]
MKLRKIVSGGQTGADQGALSACVQAGFPYGGWIPKGRRTEKGKVPARYRLRQHWSRHYPPRTEKNVVDSDGTVIFTYGKPDGGSLLTIAFAKQHGKPCLKVDLNQPHDVVVARVVRWAKRNLPAAAVLNVAGSRRSKAPGIHFIVKRAMLDVLARVN